MNALDNRIRDSRRLIRRLESEGNPAAADLEAARLSGLLDARTLMGGTDADCLHPVHKAVDLTEDGKQRWRCVDCGVVQ